MVRHTGTHTLIHLSWTYVQSPVHLQEDASLHQLVKLAIDEEQCRGSYHICWLFRHHTANVGLVVVGSAGPVPLPMQWSGEWIASSPGHSPPKSGLGMRLVNGLFNSCSTCWNVGRPIRLCLHKHRNNGNQENQVIEAVCRRPSYAGLKPDHEKAVRSFVNGRDVFWELDNQQWKVWIWVILLKGLSVAERGFSFLNPLSLAIRTSEEGNVCNEMS